LPEVSIIDEKRIGKPVSAGCIRMKNDDVMALFDEVLVNDIVLIR
jgi:lipoprotein-anchoring transpeptidase ErfK/SrfK